MMVVMSVMAAGLHLFSTYRGTPRRVNRESCTKVSAARPVHRRTYTMPASGAFSCSSRTMF